MERRNFLKLLAAGGILGLFLQGAKGETAKLLRPPGAGDEMSFLATCARCGKCAEICPLGCIEIAHGEAGLSMGTPYMTPLEHPCDLCMIPDNHPDPLFRHDNIIKQHFLMFHCRILQQNEK